MVAQRESVSARRNRIKEALPSYQPMRNFSALVNEAKVLLAELKTLQEEDSLRSAQVLDEVERILHAAETGMESVIAKCRSTLVKNRTSRSASVHQRLTIV